MKLGTLVVEIGAETAGFVKGINETKTGLRGVSTQARTTVNNLGKIATGAALAGTALAVHLVNNSRKTIDALAKTSDRLGIATEQLAGLRFAAEQTGVSVQTLEMALQRQTRRIAEAAQGSGEAKDALRELGLSAEALNKLSPDEQFRKIAGAMEGVANSGDRVRLAMRLFDSEGVALVNTLALGEQGLADMQREAERLGIALDRVQAAKVEAANDALNRASKVTEGLIQQFTVELAPILSALADEFVEMTADAGGFGNVAMEAVDGIVGVVGFLGDALRGIQVIVKGLELGFQGAALLMATSWAKVGETIETLIKGAIEQVNGLIEVANKLPKVQIDPIEMPETPEFLKKIQATRDGLLSAVEETKGELHDLMMEELPSDALDGMVERARAAMDKAAQAAVNAKQKAAGGDSGGGGLTKEQQAELEAEQAAKERRLQLLAEENAQRQELLRERYFGEQEAQRVFWETMDEMELERKENQFISEAEYQQARLNQIRDYMNNQLGVQSSGYNAITNMAAKQWNAQTALAVDALGSIVNSMAGESRKAFEIQKALGIANTVINTIDAAQGAYKFGANIGGPVLGGVMAAAAAAQGYARVQSIRSQTFGGGGGGGGAAGGGSTSLGGGGGQQQQAQQQQRDTQTIFFSTTNPDSFVRTGGLTEALNAELRNGSNLDVRFIG